jgi:hypothetical protein
LWTGFAVQLVQRGVDAEDRWKTALAAAPFAAAAACYFALPYAVGAAGMLNVRIATFGVLFAPLLVLRQEGWRGSAPIAAIFGASLVLAGNAAHEIRRVGEEELGDLGRLLDRMPPGAKVLTLPFEPTSRRMLWSPWSFVGAYHRARRGGVAGFSFSEIAHWPIHYKPGAGPPARPLFWTRNACRYRNEIDGAYYDFVLARGNVDPFRDAPPGPVFRRVDQERDFVLYARVAGETNPPWSFEDPGPCESRRSLEMRNARGL